MVKSRCVYNFSASRTVKTDKFTLFVYCNFLVLLSTAVSSENINKQIVNIADKNLTDYSFLSRYHYTKSKNYLERRYRIRHWIFMFFGTPCIFYACMHPISLFNLVYSLNQCNYMHVSANDKTLFFFLTPMVSYRIISLYFNRSIV